MPVRVPSVDAESLRVAPVRILILGYGIRGRAYADYAITHPDECVIAGLADPVAAFPRSVRALAHTPYRTFTSWEAALDADVPADAVVVSLPDKLHLPACLKALEKGYHVLLEKPIGCSWEECLAIKAAQAKAKRLVLTGYVLRFSPFYRKLREVLVSGVAGDITSIHHLVAVSYGKAAHAFCRGNWAIEENGTGMFVNKCTHDLDLIAWWTKGKACERISSFGSLFHWRPENRPAGAADRCSACPAAVRAACPFDAYALYYRRKDLRYHFADESDAAIREMIETSPYGRCVYACGNDSVDHQTVLMNYAGGLTVTLEMESYSATRRRVTHFYGTRAEIVADEHTIEIRPFVDAESLRVVVPEQHGAHGGGDREIMAKFVDLIRRASSERYAKILETALESHRLAFLAEDSRRSGKTLSPILGVEG